MLLKRLIESATGIVSEKKICSMESIDKGEIYDEVFRLEIKNIALVSSDGLHSCTIHQFEESLFRKSYLMLTII